MNSILEEDICDICSSDIVNWENLREKKILITGATGLIGSILVKTLMMKNSKTNWNIKMFLVVRNKDQAVAMFGENDLITYIESEIENFKNNYFDVDFIFHAASPTKSKYFIEQPVETLNTAIIGTQNILEFAKKTNVESVIYLSSMEMYGVMDEAEVTEDLLGYINPLDVRSSYSEGKRICELYCYSYFKEYNIPIKIGRIAQTFGAGISLNETRVYKQFADSIIKGEDIILKSSGETVINFSYTIDTIIGLLVVLLNGRNGEAYNIVSEKTNMTILDSAKWLIETYGTGNNKVEINISETREGFAPKNKMILDNKKIKKLGWKNKYSLKVGYDRLIKYLKEEYKM